MSLENYARTFIQAPPRCEHLGDFEFGCPRYSMNPPRVALEQLSPVESKPWTTVRRQMST